MEAKLSIPNIFLSSSGLLFLIKNDEAEAIVRIHGNSHIAPDERHFNFAEELAGEWRNQGFGIACGCRKDDGLFPSHAIVYRNGTHHLRQVNDVRHASGCTLSLGPERSFRRPNMRTEFRLK